MHRKMRNMATMTGLYPLAVLSDRVVCPPPGGFRLGPTPGLGKLEGVQSMLWTVDVMEKGLNPARHIRGGDAVLDEGG